MALTKSEELKATASEKFAEANEILTRSEASAEDVARGEALVAEAEADLARAETLDGIAKRTAQLNTVVRKRPVADTVETAEKEDEAVREAKAFESFLRTGQRAALNTGAVEAGKGDAFIPSTVAARIIDVASKEGPMLDPSVVTIFNTPTGEDWSIPNGDDREHMAYEVEEGSDHPDESLDFGKITFKSVEYGSGIVPITAQMKRDGVLGGSLDAHVIRKLGQRLGRRLNVRFTNGNGTTQPQGLVTGLLAAGARIETTATTGFVWNDFLRAEEALEEAYNESAIWMLNRKKLQSLRAIAASDNAPVIFQGNYALGAPPTLFGRRYVINNALTDNQVVLGDIKETFGVRAVGNVEVKTTKELFFRKNMDGVALFASYDSRVMNAAASVLLTLKV